MYLRKKKVAASQRPHHKYGDENHLQGGSVQI